MKDQKRLAKLANLVFQKPDKVLTLYLHTDRSHPDQQGGEWKIALKSGFNRLEEYAKLSCIEEYDRLCSIRGKVEVYLSNLGRKLPRGIVIVASEDSGIWETFELQIPVPTKFYWEEKPMLDEFLALQEDHPLTAYVLMQQNQVKIVETSFATIKNSETILFDIDTEDWRRYEGPSQRGNIKSATQTDQFDHRLKVNHQRWVKSLGSVLDKKAADGRWEKIVLVGDKEDAALLDESMNKRVDAIVQKNLFNENEHKVMEILMGA